MPSLTTLPATASDESILACFGRDGAVILEAATDAGQLDVLMSELAPYIDHTPMGFDDFSGKLTQRTGALVARSPACRRFVLDEKILALANQFLGPWTDRLILHLAQTIKIHPGSPAQSIHRDRLAWGGYLPREIEPQFNTIWALTDFTADNGATRLVPGSHRWSEQERARPDQYAFAEMTVGSVLLYSGSVLHSGGANNSNAPRLGMNITYCLAWLRQEENQYLSCPPAIARDLEPALQDLLGYTLGAYALGYYSEPAPAAGDNFRETLPPEHALGRKPSRQTS